MFLFFMLGFKNALFSHFFRNFFAHTLQRISSLRSTCWTSFVENELNESREQVEKISEFQGRYEYIFLFTSVFAKGTIEDR